MNGEEPTSKRTGMRFCWRLLMCALFYGPAVYFKFQGDYITAAILAVSGVAAFGGYRAGALSILTLLVAFSAAAFLAPSIGTAQEAQFTEWLGTTGLTNRLVSIGLTGLLMAVVISIFLIVVSKKIVRQRPAWDATNRWTGFVLGGVEGAAAMVLFLGGILMVEPIEMERAPQRDPSDTQGQMVSKFILETSEKTRQSTWGATIVAYNPFEKIPQLNKIEEVHQSVQVLSDPGKIQNLLHHPSIRKLQRRPEVRRVVDELTSDPEIAAVLRSGTRMDRSGVMMLMNHPAVLKLLDQPGFMEQAAQVIQGAIK